ncbi:MAG: lytic transglycosylase domain-containing protein [Acidobacteria bacterium]|nr:lytic transglycosylase domain-containing protein [Acidobacteriota bacterium]
MSRWFKLALVLITFFAVPSLCKHTIIALTAQEEPPNKQAEAEAEPSVEAEAQGAEESPFNRLIAKAGAKYGVDPLLIRLVMGQESRFKANAHSPKNAQGLMQLIPDTAKRFGIKNPYDPQQNIDGGARYLSWLLNRFDGDVKLALAGYNAGENAVKRYGNKVPPYKETRQYVNKITAAYGSEYHQVPAQKKTSTKPLLATVQ